MSYANGKWRAAVVSGHLTVAKTGTEQIAVKFGLRSGPDEGSEITEYLALTDKALPYTLEKLRTCGWQGDNVEDLSSLGGEVDITIADEVGRDGVARARVKYIDPPGAAGTPVPEGVGAKWREKIRALGGVPGGGTPGNGKAPF